MPNCATFHCRCEDCGRTELKEVQPGHEESFRAGCNDCGHVTRWAVL